MRTAHDGGIPEWIGKASKEGSGNDRERVRAVLHEYVTEGGLISVAGDITARSNEMLKMGIFRAGSIEVDGKATPGHVGDHAIVSDEPPALGGGAVAPVPLQYFLAGIAF